MAISKLCAEARGLQKPKIRFVTINLHSLHPTQGTQTNPFILCRPSSYSACNSF